MGRGKISPAATNPPIIRCARRRCSRPLTWVNKKGGWIPVGRFKTQIGFGYACESCRTVSAAVAALAARNEAKRTRGRVEL